MNLDYNNQVGQDARVEFTFSLFQLDLSKTIKSVMKKRLINWSWGNPAFSAWVIDSPAGVLILRRNHDPIRTGGRHCEGWDLWLDGRYLGAVGSRTFLELVTLSRRELSTLVRSDCCAQHRDFAFGADSEPATGKHGGR